MPEQAQNKNVPRSLVRGYREFLRTNYVENQDLFERLESEGQSPRVLWVGCADSRVSPELIMGAKPGELFILRNVANMVPPCEAGENSVASALCFAVKQLNVDHIVVCGHSDCGGVKAMSSMDRERVDAPIAQWVEYGREALSGWSSVSGIDALVRANAVLQAERLLSYDFIAEANQAGNLSLHACFYSIGTGILERFEPLTQDWRPLG